MLHIPVLRAGQAYRSLQTVELSDVRDGSPVARVSQANAGLIAKDLRNSTAAQALSRLSVAELIAICRRAAQAFVEEPLPMDPIDDVVLTPDEFVAHQSSTTGLPQSLCRANMEKTRYVLSEIETVLRGLTRGLDLAVLDEGWSDQGGSQIVSYVRQASTLGAVLPSNSPGVHSLWLPAIPLKVGLALKPGRHEPWTPMRVLQALIAAGCPREALGFYPCDYSGAAEILMRTDRSMIFGDASTVGGWKNDPRVQLHGPGWSKVLLADDQAPQWRRHIEIMVQSIADNGGRSCLNASGVWVTANGAEIAQAIAEQLVEIEARPLDDPDARLAAFSDPVVAHRTSEYIDSLLATPGATDITRELRGTDRVVELDGVAFVLPTLIWCEDPDHPLTKSELLFPFCSVVQVPQAELLDRIGSTLVGTVLSEDQAFLNEVFDARHIDRLNVGSFPTSRISWDQPHEGNLFEHLYRQRALQHRSAGTAA